MKYITAIALIALPAMSSAVSMDGCASFSYEGDSLGFSSGRLRTELGVVLTGGSWKLSLEEAYVSSDSGGIVPRYLTNFSRSDLDFRYSTGSYFINPDFRFCVDPEDGSELVLPVQAGTAIRRGYMRPGLSMGIGLPGNIRLVVRGNYWNRDIETENGSSLGWTESHFGGGLTWETPWGFDLSGSGVKHNTTSDDIDYEVDWSRVDMALSVAPRSFPTRTHVMAGIKYSMFDGKDFLNNPLANRMTARVRAVQAISTDLAFNMTLTSVFDFDGDETRIAANKGVVRLVFHFMKTGRVPSSISVGGQYTGSSIETSRLDVSTRINIWKGLSLLLNVDLWEGPTSVAGADPTRRRVVLGSGLEYRLAHSLLAWACLEQERTEFSGVEIWERLRTGLEFYPGRLSF